jgi:hypothetical protein
MATVGGVLAESAQIMPDSSFTTLGQGADMMSLSLIAGAFWVLAATGVAFLPMRQQYPPGIVLLLAAPVLLGWIAVDHGVWWAGLGAFAFVSMFRNPIFYLVRRLRGEQPEIPS